MVQSLSSPDGEANGFSNGHGLGEPPAKKHKGNGGQETQSSGRRQAACQPCRLRKVKCDKKRPCCGLCRAGGVVCEYMGDSAEKITLETATHTILERLDALRQEIDSVKQGQFQQNNIFTRPQHELPVESNLPPATPAHETSRDFLRIPPHCASADTILQWEIFHGRYPPNALIGVLFAPDSSDLPPSHRSPASPAHDLITSPKGLTPLDEEQIPSLIDRFLTNVYTKNPILDVESLVKHGRRCADHGVGWDGWSCLVLIACALGSVAKPFDRSVAPSADRNRRNSNASSAQMYSKELQQGDSCFTLACRRLGSLKYSMLGAQCHFFAGVYLMYTLRPLQSWNYFFQASNFTQLHLRMTHGLSDSFAKVLSAPSQALSSTDRKARRIEQSLYWSCFKSECEFRIELPMPQSDISLGEYPALFPSPPSPGPITRDAEAAPTSSSAEGITDQDLDLRQHAMRLCNEEESWYYYLTEIALRRIGNRIINTFFPTPDRASWLNNIRPLLRMAQEFEAQVSSWSAHLPPAMQQYETSSMIRAPHLNFTGDGARSYVSRELSWAVDNRLLEMQTWLYQPFLYYLIHAGLPGRANSSTNPASNAYNTNSPVLESRQAINNLLNPWSPSATTSSTHSVDYVTHPGPPPPPTASSPTTLDADDVAVLESLVASGIECSFKTIDVRARGHRHHGLWYDLRSIMSASLILLAIVKSGNAAWLPGGVDALWGGGGGDDEYNGRGGGGGAPRPIGGRMAKVLASFEFWAAEAPDMRRYSAVLEEVVRDVRGS